MKKKEPKQRFKTLEDIEAHFKGVEDSPIMEAILFMHSKLLEQEVAIDDLYTRYGECESAIDDLIANHVGQRKINEEIEEELKKFREGFSYKKKGSLESLGEALKECPEKGVITCGKGYKVETKGKKK